MSATSDKGVSRRGFLKVLGAGGLAAFFSPARALASHPSVPKGDGMAALVDLTRCIGCRSCTRACQTTNQSIADPKLTSLDVAEPLSFDRWTAVNLAGAEPRIPVKRQCMHCLEPACASACPVGALEATPSGPVIYHSQRCIGCRYCMVACPFDVPKFEWNSGLTPVIGKCQFCARERLRKGLEPACAESCPTGAIKFGKRQSLLFDAHARLRAQPEKYVPRVYGENEVGGTSWLYIAGVPFEQLGFPKDLPNYPLPSLTWEVISRLPIVVAFLSGILGVLGLTLTRQEKRRHARREPAGSAPPEDPS